MEISGDKMLMQLLTDLNARVTNTTVWTARWTVHQASCTPFHSHCHSSYFDILEQRGSSSIFGFYLIIRSCKAIKRQLFQSKPEPSQFEPKIQTVVFCLIMYWFHTSTKYYIVYDIKNKACYTKKSQRPITATTPWAIKKRATLFLIITPAFLGRFLYFLYQ